MPYKIIQTIEEGIAKLSIVPALWESKGIVRWPPKNTKYLLKLIKNENSIPEAGWDAFKCLLKRNNIRTYDEANREISEMTLNSDTDFQENNDNIRSVLGTSKTGGQNVDGINFDTMAENLCNPQLEEYVPMENVQQIQVVGPENLEPIIANQALILDKVNTVIENQKKIANKVASLSVQLDEIYTTITLQQERPLNVTLLKDALPEESESFSLKHIETSDEFEIFEMTLADRAQKKKLAKQLSLLCSTSHGKGITCAYKLLDILISRDFLCQCSWSGGSKGEVSKIPLKNFKNFRKFFFEMVNSWDPNFTDDDTVKFFKLVLRNASKRKTMKSLRASTKRTRKNTKNSDNEMNIDNDTKNPEANNDSGKPETSNDGKKPGSNDGNDRDNDDVDLC